ncbi:MAG: hypothetical protein M1812_000299 [Candelaria pacifica]|nr:MAG: hypothetical protein M1812_000299 [Candelaria pacifica]
MNPPSTPKKTSDELNEYIRSLSESWALQLPLRQDIWSPSSRSRNERNTNNEAFRCVAHIRYLFYKRPTALQGVRISLSEYARGHVTDWKFKPRQEPGTLPQLPLPAVKDQFLARSDISDQLAAKLRHYLLKLLEDEVYMVKEKHAPTAQNLDADGDSSRPRHSVPSTTASPAHPVQPNVGRMAPKKSTIARTTPSASKGLVQQSLIEVWKSISKPTSLPNTKNAQKELDSDPLKATDPVIDSATVVPSKQPVTPNLPPDSSVTYMDDQDDEDFRSYRTQHSEPDANTSGNDASLADVSDLLKQELDGDTEVFYTPPSSPLPSTDHILSRQLARLKIENFAGDLSTDISFTKMADIVPIPTPNHVRKRKLEDETGFTRKRGPPEVNVNSISPQESLKEANLSVAVSAYMPTHPPGGRRAASMSKRQSSIAGIIPDALFSANTSFNSNESATTSFSSVFSDSASRSNITSASTSFTSAYPEAPRTSGKDRSSFTSVSNTSARMNNAPSITKPNIATSSVFSSRLQILKNLEQNLFMDGPLSHQLPTEFEASELRLRYELTRIALDCKIPLTKLSRYDNEDFSEYSSFWQWLLRQKDIQTKITLRQSSAQAWKAAGERFKDVSMTGELTFNQSQSGPLLKLSLHPLKIEPSFRYSRRFGNDRFMVLSLPELSATSMPKSISQEEALVRESVTNWLCSTQHTLLGRTWKAFSCKPVRRAKLGKKETKPTNTSKSNANVNEASHYIYFFAVSGCDMLPNPSEVSKKGEGLHEHTEMSVQALLEWAFPRSRNLKMAYPKAFQRYHLLLSKTQETVIFLPKEVIRCDDTTTRTSLPRRLDPTKSDLIKRDGRGKVPDRVPMPDGVVMNDGCARISYPAACGIAQALHLEYLPCAYQGRIAGGKGVWIVDYTDEKLGSSERNYWIEVTDSQWKFEGHPGDDSLFPDQDRLTFEVCSWSRPLSPATLNEQLIPILVDRQRPTCSIEEALKELLEEDLWLRVSLLRVAMDDPLALRRWNQENNPVGDERAKLEGIQNLGAFPAELGEQINWFLEQGFTPQSCSFFMKRMTRAVTAYRERLENRMHMGVARSTTCLMVADPTGQLEEGEVQLCFSRPFRIPNTTDQDDMLCDLDCLVSRNPAHCPWDIQKVRAVFKPGLRHYKDVVVFSCKGERPLAEALSGGDYDGDTAWVCWEPRLVGNFINHKPPVPTDGSTTRALRAFGIIQEEQTIADMASCADFLLKGFNFNLQPNLLGMCTSFRERICYKENSISFGGARLLATLLGLLVDAPKQGYKFTETTWQMFLHDCPDLPQYWPPVPAYKLKKDAVPTDHIIDQLLLVKAKDVIEDCMKRFHTGLKDIQSSDDDLSCLWKQEYEDSSTDAEVKRILNQLIKDVRAVADYWKSSLLADEDTQHKEGKFAAVVQIAHGHFSKIMPLSSSHPLVVWWGKEAARRGDASFWSHLKASRAFYGYSDTTFPWYIAGKHLGELKALASGKYHTVVTPIFISYKLDPGHVKRVESKRPVLEKADESLEHDGVWE